MCRGNPDSPVRSIANRVTEVGELISHRGCRPESNIEAPRQVWLGPDIPPSGILLELDSRDTGEGLARKPRIEGVE